jgi:hypothetical protein
VVGQFHDGDAGITLTPTAKTKRFHQWMSGECLMYCATKGTGTFAVYNAY